MDGYNRYTFEEIEVGHKESFKVTVTEEMLDSFRRISGDVNPLHNDEAYAKDKGYPARVAYGMLTASFLSTLAGVYIPGERSLIKETHIKFTKPVFPGDEIEVVGEVEEKHEGFDMIVLKVTMVNGKGEKVLRGRMDVIVRE